MKILTVFIDKLSAISAAFFVKCFYETSCKPRTPAHAGVMRLNRLNNGAWFALNREHYNKNKLFIMLLLIITLGFMGISLLVGMSLKAAFKRYSTIRLRSGLTGREVAEKMLRDNGIYDVQVTSVPGMLTDHYNPANKTVNLSEEVYNGNSISSAAVAAHECGHAVQHATAYPFLKMRSTLVPVTLVANKVMGFVMMFGLFGGLAMHWFNAGIMLYIIVAAQSAIVLFTLITLPVEFDATKRGLAWLERTGLTSGDEHTKARHALRLAATTYVVAALSAISVLLYFVLQLVARRD